MESSPSPPGSLVLAGGAVSMLAVALFGLLASGGDEGAAGLRGGSAAASPDERNDEVLAAFEWSPAALLGLHSVANSRGMAPADAARLIHDCVLAAEPDASPDAHASFERELTRTLAWDISPVTRMVPLREVFAVVVARRRQGTPLERVIATLR